MTPRWRGLVMLLADATEHGSRAVERIQLETVRRPLALAAMVAPLPAWTRTAATVHRVVVGGVHVAIRGGATIAKALVR